MNDSPVICPFHNVTTGITLRFSHIGNVVSTTVEYHIQWRSQKVVMEGVQNRGHIGAGEGGVSGEGVLLP